MAQSMLMKKGLEDIFNPEKKFESEANFGQKIYYVAWAVEILAATIGFTIALAFAYDAYIKIQNPDTNDLINAVIGALPFAIIAVIEPTKIALAGGLYKTRIIGWKLLIFAALAALTIVTFETIFNGLERTLSNTTRVITSSENELLGLQDEKLKKTIKLENLQEKSIEELTKDLRIQIDETRERYSEEILAINNASDEIIQSLEKLKSEKQKELDSLSSVSDAVNQSQLKNIDSEIDRAEKKIEQYSSSRENEIQQATSRFSKNSANREKDKNQKLDALKEQINSKDADLKLFNNKLENLSEREISAKNSAKDFHEDSIESLQNEMENTNILQRGKREQLNNEIQNEKRRFQSELNSLDTEFENERLTIEAEIEEIKAELKKLEDAYQNELGLNTGSSSALEDEIKIIRKKWQAKIAEQDALIAKLQKDRSEIVGKQTGADTRKRNALQAEIDAYQRDIVTENKARAEKQERAKNKTDLEMAGLEENLNLEIQNIQMEKNNIQPLELEIENLTSKINETKSVIREEIQKNQVYRIAALFYKKNDVVDVTREEVRNVAIVWFGSIAAITATIGTILALISFILRDPEAFVERPKFSITRRISVILRRLNKLLLALIRLFLSLAEVFRGIVGVPLQRALRRTLLAYRKKLNNPRIEKVEVEVEVEKIIEKPVEKIVEVEIEKIVEVEVPVDKIVTKEVPVEIVRKEMVYVPLYSTDSGLIDASTELKGAKPKISEDDRNAGKTQQNEPRKKSKE